jgi:DNA-binding NarL/FixJ family response regulator
VFGQQLREAASSAQGGARVVVCDEHVLARRALIAGLEDSGLAEILAEAGSGEEAVADARHYAPDVAFVSMVLPGLSGTQTIRLITDVMPGITVVALAVEEDPDERLDALRAGASSVIDKERMLGESDTMIERILRGAPVFDAPTGAALLDRFDALVDGQAIAGLSGRERSVLEAVAGGDDPVTGGVLMTISPAEARNHLLNVLFRLHLGAPLEPSAEAAPLLAQIGS